MKKKDNKLIAPRLVLLLNELRSMAKRMCPDVTFSPGKSYKLHNKFIEHLRRTLAFYFRRDRKKVFSEAYLRSLGPAVSGKFVLVCTLCGEIMHESGIRKEGKGMSGNLQIYPFPAR